ncbi:MAG TPA: SDR family NAD(P)-dependent oxidoreductase, partial [Syntrophomonadaceae bacterium]|nr:SDR family NAD(P)-dependent oxidoreductase [Syntrophomonadaceae bacterium]
MLVEATMRALPEILTGKILATDIMFPNSSMKLVEGIYKNNVIADYFNEVLADTVVVNIQERLTYDSSVRIRILEIGAGTGGTSAMVFQKLQPYREHIQEYCYTDISKAFLMHAEREYSKENPYLTYEIFNVEESIAVQGIDEGGYDILIATNVLHATKNIRQTLRNAKAALKKNGWLLLNEISSNSLFTHLTFGLLKGWWLYEDTALRIPGCPGLYPETWRVVLESEGFQSIFPAQEAHKLGQQIIVAESDGVVRQKQVVEPILTMERNEVKTSVFNPEPTVQSRQSRQTGGITSEFLREKSIAFFKKIIGEVLKIPNNKIDPSEPLEKYGIDSILVVQLNNALRKVFNNINSTLFFEYQTIDALVEHFVKTQKDSLMTLLRLEEHEFNGEISGGNEIVVEKPIMTSKLALRKSGLFLNAPENIYAEHKSAIEPIAIIGISGRYPQARNLQEYWNNLKTGKDCIIEIPQERWPLDGFYHSDPGEALAQGKSYCKRGGFIEGFTEFDPLFFNISPREALAMDPQERLFIEECWKTLEDAGYTKEQIASKYKGRVGVFAGITKTGFELYGPELWKQGELVFPRTSFSSVANRISYLLNFNGPSIPVDTMCSSSLTAIHEACEHISRGECEMAIAGGVNLCLHPLSFIYLSSLRMLSADGSCKSFGQGADGFVSGEGVGAILLKRLSQAIDDQDNIYAVIRGTSINHGGKTNGYTVPNPLAQGALIRAALNKAEVNARAISYVEAHGTGTELGDPIEITGLIQAFCKDTKDTGFCAIGSVKSNIGHLEATAGIAGVTKIILQMKHQQIVPSLHAKELNPNIKFSETPFVVQQELTEWKRPIVEINGNKKEYPRIAGISSFGAGGSNAHVVIEEYISQELERPPITITPQNPAIIVLSAKNEERLKEQARQLLTAIKEGQYTDTNLADMAYTLQTGREAMEERLGMTIGSLKELEEKLQGFVNNTDNLQDVYRGQVKRNKDALAVLAMDEEMQETIDKWIDRKKYSKVLDLWVKGLNFDWNNLYGDVEPRRISLPTYPFARERYWVPEVSAKSASVNTNLHVGAFIHPLLHQNTSNFSEQKFTATFTGQEFFLADHVVQGQRVLPGAAYLEMARAAVEQAIGPMENGKPGIRLKNVIWVRPIIVGNQPVQIQIGLYREENGEIAYEVYSEADAAEIEPIVYSQGYAVLTSITKSRTLDLATIQAQCNQSILTPSQCYEVFKAMGIEYGLGHRGIEEVYVGSDQVLARLSLPFSVSETKGDYVLHPSMMDSALQASIGLMINSGNKDSMISLKPSLPFALQEIEVFNRCTSSMWAFICFSEGSKATDKVQKLDIAVCDDYGNICVQMKGFSLRVLEGEAGSVGVPASTGTLMIEPYWREEAIAEEIIASEYTEHLVMLCEPNEVSQENIEAQMNGVRCFALESDQDSIEERFQNYTVQVFEEIQGILKDKSKDRVLAQMVVSRQNEQQLFTGLSGLLKTAQLENSKIIVQLIEVEPGENSESIIKKLKENSRSTGDKQIRYQAGKRHVLGWSEIEVTKEENKIPWKDQGVYLITGGAGGLGLIFAQEIAQKVKNATLILTGRSELNKDKQSRLKEIEILGAQIKYKQVDVTDQGAVTGLIQGIREEYGHLNGIIHSAGVIKDNFIIKKTKEEIEEVLAPKVKGLVNLDQASQDLSLDFFILFSSVAAILGNLGQADYATANAFMDSYARYRNGLVKKKQRQGQTLSINWPLWKEGGMQVDDETEKMMMQTSGMIPMQTSTGIQVFYRSLISGYDQVLAVQGNLLQVKKRLLLDATTVTAQPEKATAPGSEPDIDTGRLLAGLQSALVQSVSRLLKVKIEDIDTDTELSEYGFDSITFTQFANQLNKEYQLELAPTVFFEHPTIHSFTQYLIQEHPAVFVPKYAALPRYQASAIIIGDEAQEGPSPRQRSHFPSVALPTSPPEPSISESIAIIGISGVFPQALDVNQFWGNLMEDKNCITEIPEDRWNWRQYYGDPATCNNKTNIKWGGFIDGISEFDPLFFGISPREARFMDPQQRLLMIHVWKAIEDAGYSAGSLSGTKTGIFVGTANSGYDKLVSQANIAIESYSSTGTVPSVGPNRMSYFLNLHGPSEAIETACSSSLVAIHRAVSAIQDGGCEMAIAGGVNTIVTPELHISFSKAGMLCEDGQCKTFSSQADGYVRGEGAGMLFLKKLKDAEVAGDHIYGLIIGSTENHGGRGSSLTAPNPKAQAELLVTAYTRARIDPRTVTYIEAHGTGTELGDPIEINALKAAFKELYQATGDSHVSSAHCGLGSVKTNIGHLELAAGVAGVIKILLQLKHQTLVKSLHCDSVNQYIDLQNSPFYIVQDTKEWKPLQDEGKNLPRRAGVSSLGFGGSNAHIVIEEYTPSERIPITITPQNPAIIVLSAKNEDRLNEQVQQLLTAIRGQQFSNSDLADMAYTLQVGREAMEERL